MKGEPFIAMQERMLDIADTIFSPVYQNMFSEVHTVYYCRDLFPHVTTSKESYIEKIKSEVKPSKGTNFVKCFEYMEQQLDLYPAGTRFSVIFLTDGCEYPTSGKLNESLNNLIKKLKEDVTKPSLVQCLGFSKNHDAKLLNKLAQAGSEVGNFVYIDENADIKA